MGDDSKQPTLGAVVGRNVRRLRDAAGLTGDDVASRARLCGLPWTRSAVAALENGGRRVDLGELPLIGMALGVGPSELLAGDGAVQLTDEMVLELSAVRDFYAHGTVPRMTLSPVIGLAMQTYVQTIQQAARAAIVGQFRDVIPEAPRKAAKGLTEQRAAQKLGLDPVVLSYLAFKLWGRSLTDERDAQAGPDAAKGTRGVVTRRLVQELADRLKEDQ